MVLAEHGADFGLQLPAESLRDAEEELCAS